MISKLIEERQHKKSTKRIKQKKKNFKTRALYVEMLYTVDGGGYVGTAATAATVLQ